MVKRVVGTKSSKLVAGQSDTRKRGAHIFIIGGGLAGALAA